MGVHSGTMNNTYLFCTALLMSACNLNSCNESSESVEDASISPEPTVDAGDVSDASPVEHIIVDVIMQPLDAGEEGIALPPEEGE
jgi:hypothetical protein